MNIPFKTNYVEGDENVMVIVNDSVKEIRFNQKTRNIIIVCEDLNVYNREDIDELSWQSLKKIVETHGGKWINKSSAIEFLIGKPKEI